MQSNITPMRLPRHINHVGIVVKDLDESMKLISAMFKVGPWHIFEFTEKMNAMFPSDPFRIKIAEADIGATLVELLQPIEGRSIWSDFLQTRGGGLHHVGYSISDYDNILSIAQEKGSKIVAGGVWCEKTRWFCFEVGLSGPLIDVEEKIRQKRPILK